MTDDAPVLRDSLKRHLRHVTSCAVADSDDGPVLWRDGDEADCNCGLAVLVAALAGRPETAVPHSERLRRI